MAVMNWRFFLALASTLILLIPSSGQTDTQQCEADDQTCQEEAVEQCTSVVITPNSTGLFHDAAVLKRYLGSKITTFEQPAVANCKVRIFLEHTAAYLQAKEIPVHEDWLDTDTPAWIVINSDQFYDEILLQTNLVLILCKTQQCVDWMQKARERLGKTEIPIVYLGFTSLVDALTTSENELDFDRILHVAGQSPFKGTISILHAWLNHPQWPVLTLTSFRNMQLQVALEGFYKKGAKLPANINHIDRKLSSEELTELQTTHGIHLCLSGMEGFGHYINEARSVGAAIAVTNYPSMNEFFVRPKQAILVEPVELIDWNNGMKYAHVDAAGVAEAVYGLLEMPKKNRKAMGESAHAAFERDRRYFEDRLWKLKQSLMGTCEEDTPWCGLKVE